MADHFLGALQALERRAQDNILVFSDVLVERLDALVESMINQPLSTNDYLKTLELYYQKYKRMENAQGMYFCVFRMQQIQQLVKTKKKRHYQYLEVSDKIDERIDSFLEQHKNYYGDSKDEVLRVLILISLGISIFLMIFLILVLKVSFFFGWGLALIVLLGLWVLSDKVILDEIIEKRVQQYYPSIDELCAEFDRSAMTQKH